MSLTELTERDYLQSVWQALRRIEATLSVLTLPPPEVNVTAPPPDLTDIVTAVTSMGVGATAAGAVAADTQLGSTPTILAFDALPTRAALVVTCIRTFATGEANISWNELAMFNGTVNGTSTMCNRIAPIGPFNKTSAVSIAATCQVTQS